MTGRAVQCPVADVGSISQCPFLCDLNGCRDFSHCWTVLEMSLGLESTKMTFSYVSSWTFGWFCLTCLDSALAFPVDQNPWHHGSWSNPQRGLPPSYVDAHGIGLVDTQPLVQTQRNLRLQIHLTGPITELLFLKLSACGLFWAPGADFKRAFFTAWTMVCYRRSMDQQQPEL